MILMIYFVALRCRAGPRRGDRASDALGLATGKDRTPGVLSGRVRRSILSGGLRRHSKVTPRWPSGPSKHGPPGVRKLTNAAAGFLWRRAPTGLGGHGQGPPPGG